MLFPPNQPFLGGGGATDVARVPFVFCVLCLFFLWVGVHHHDCHYHHYHFDRPVLQRKVARSRIKANALEIRHRVNFVGNAKQEENDRAELQPIAYCISSIGMCLAQIRLNPGSTRVLHLGFTVQSWPRKYTLCERMFSIKSLDEFSIYIYAAMIYEYVD